MKVLSCILLVFAFALHAAGQSATGECQALLLKLNKSYFEESPELAFEAALQLDSIAHLSADSALIAQGNLYVAEGLRRQWELEASLERALAAFKFFEHSNNVADYLLAAEIICFTTIVTGQITDYVTLFHDALGVAIEAGDDYQQGNLHTAIAVSNEEFARFELAAEHHNEALRIRKAAKDTVKWGGSLVNLANVYQFIDEPEFSIELLEEAIALFDEVGELNYKINALHNLSVAFAMLEKYDDQKRISDELFDLFMDMGNYQNAASLFSSLALTLQTLNRMEEAGEAFRKGLEIAETYLDQKHPTVVNIRIGLVGHLFKAGKPDEGSLAFEEIRDLPIDEYSIAIAKYYHKAAYENYRHLGKFDRSLNHLEKYISARDSLRSADNSRLLVQQQIRYGFEKKEALLRAEQEKKDALATEELRRKNLQRNASFGGFGLMLLLALVFFSQRLRIAKEKQRSEDLLLNILPAETAEELKATGTSQARHIEQVTVLFTDFKGFTALSENLPPDELVAMINECFSVFDRITEKYGIEKIKTIGDAYMAAGGLPTPNQTHAVDVVRAALEIQAFMADFKSRRQAANQPSFEIRIGIHTGPVVAGIVGIKKFQYDIWGDTVNTAARMESSGEVGQVNISEATYKQVKGRFACSFRGEIEAKGKGKLGMYFVTADTKTSK